MSNRRLPTKLRTAALGIVRTQYADFGPTLAHEKLVEKHGLELSVETLRKWMRSYVPAKSIPRLPPTKRERKRVSRGSNWP